MPKVALRPCLYPGCPELVEKGYCEKHEEMVAEMRRGANVRDPKVHRLYGTRRWEKMRERQLAKQPWCEECLKKGIHTPATDVHHVVRHEGNTDLFFNSELKSLCHSCHSKITSAEVRGEGAEKVSV